MRKYFLTFFFSHFFANFFTMKRAFKETTLFRKQFCISQRDLAAYLDISYSALAMYERGERPLAAKALIKFAALCTANDATEKVAGLHKTLPALQEKMDKQRDEAVEKMQWLITDHRRRIVMLQYKLKNITLKHEGAAGRLQLFDQVLAALPQSSALKHSRQALEAIHTRACEGLLKAHAQKLKMQLDIALLEAEAGVYEALVIKLKEEYGL